MNDFPFAPDQLTAAWLTRALGFAVDDFEVNYFSEGTGVIAWVTRVQLSSASAHPDSIIAKFPSPSPVNRDTAVLYNMYGREVQFYRDIAASVPVRTPACYFARHDPSSHDFVLLLEDLGDWRIGDQVTGCTLEEARAVISTIADLHASAWQPEQFPDLISHDNPMQHDGMVSTFQIGWPVVVKQWPDLIPAAAHAAAEKLPGAVAGLLSAMCEAPVCLAHADVRLDNIFFADGQDKSGTQVALVDWQSICTSAPEQDLAYFITQSVAPEIRSQEDLVARYHAELTDRGIDYSLERCRERYRISALYLMCYAAIIAGTLDMANERGAALARTIVRNCLGALDEMDAFSLL